MKAKHTKQLYFRKLKHTIEVYNSDNEYCFSIWLLYTIMVYVYWYSILYHDTMLLLYLTKVYYTCIRSYAEAIPYHYILNIY